MAVRIQLQELHTDGSSLVHNTAMPYKAGPVQQASPLTI